MRKKRLLLASSLAVILGLAFFARALVLREPSGNWPVDWPKVLDPLRSAARTVGIATGIQQNIYEITFSDRATFETAWPTILSLKSPGAPLTLYKVGSAPPSDWGNLLSNAAPIVRIYAPAYGGEIEMGGEKLKLGPPWPASIISPKGELPEFVVAKKVNGKLQWIDAVGTPDTAGFHYRARIEIELVVDGQVIDLNRIPLPSSGPIIDKRF
ncbi:MAG: hypothetical protein ABSH08_08090 [Tepidisphaeraceae bacterium]|jgi:hypothetical protein